MLKHDINTDRHVELLLTAFRRKILLGAIDLDHRPDVHNILCAMAQQCIYNEYVWYVTPRERAVLTQHIETSKQELDQGKADWKKLAIIAMYEHVGSLLPDDMNRSMLLQRIDTAPECLIRLIDKVLAEHETEQALKQSIKHFGRIERATSRMIAENYEKYPYPRWINWEFPKRGERINWLRQFFSPDELAFTDRPFNVLVAGCGTGSKAIEYAIGYGDKARILAIDLSKTSLAYATRMADEYQLDNIEFMQMDLLDLPNFNQQFDIAECTGVLHHLQDPVAGGAAIASRVREGGIVHISLYSALARRELAGLRNDYGLHADMNNDEIRERRYRILQERGRTIEHKICLRWDFFDLHRCKDLLFHPLERCFTLPEIANMLDELGLEFRGLENPGIVETQYWTTSLNQVKHDNIESWHEFEKKNPAAFGNLYEIWTLNAPVQHQ